MNCHVKQKQKFHLLAFFADFFLAYFKLHSVMVRVVTKTANTAAAATVAATTPKINETHDNYDEDGAIKIPIVYLLISILEADHYD